MGSSVCTFVCTCRIRFNIICIVIYITCFLSLAFKGLVEKDHFIILAYHHHWMKNTFLSPCALHVKKTITLSYFDKKRILCSSVYVWYPLISIVVSFILHSIFPPLLPITQEDTYFHVGDCKCHWLWKLHPSSRNVLIITPLFRPFINNRAEILLPHFACHGCLLCCRSLPSNLACVTFYAKYIFAMQVWADISTTARLIVFNKSMLLFKWDMAIRKHCVYGKKYLMYPGNVRHI